MDQTKPWFLIVILVVVGLLIIVAGYYISWYTNPPASYEKYIVMKSAQQSDVNDEFIKANITVESDDDNFSTLTCQKDHQLIYCDDNFTNFYVSDTNEKIMLNKVYHKNVYQFSWKEDEQFDMFGVLPRMLIFKRVINKIVSYEKDGYISEQDLIQGIYQLYGTEYTLSKNDNRYEIIFDQTNDRLELKIIPDNNNKDAIFKEEMSVTFRSIELGIELNKNTFK